MRYYEGSLLQLQFSPTHGCGSNEQQHCNIVVQYMCGNTDETDGTRKDGEERDRNHGLWAADRSISNRDYPATITRQNNNGNRRGLEGPEERDYYPYWHPTPWRDIAVLTSNVDDCPIYQNESQNVASKNACVSAAGVGSRANTQAACVAPDIWASYPAHRIPAPYCGPAPTAEPNQPSHADWTLPTAAQEPCIANDNCNCVLRLRYNISTLNSGAYTSAARPTLTAADNGLSSPVKENPIVQQDGQQYKLAIDTTQFGRVFQDRGHVFHIRPRGASLPAATPIHNLNVRGKRGNIVQTFSALEYAFAPHDLSVAVGDFVHFQWTGCDNNPAGNAGQGTDGTDRSNVVQLSHPADAHPASDAWISAHPSKVMFPDLVTRRMMGYAEQNASLCKSYSDLLLQNANNTNLADADPESCFKLNKADQRFDGGTVQMTTRGVFHYMSTRNNNFSNRNQKGVHRVGVSASTMVVSSTSSSASASTAGSSETGQSVESTANFSGIASALMIVALSSVAALI